MHARHVAIAVVAVLLAAAGPAHACHDGSPLILDLNGDGIQTTDTFDPVDFDLDGDGATETVAWTRPETEEGILCLDLNRDGTINSGRELFGDATMLPDGEPAAHGFEALAVYDDPAFGGNGDGVVSPEDLVWRDLRIWVDRNHDGVSQPHEVKPLSGWGILGLGLDFTEHEEVDPSGNYHRFQSWFTRRVVRQFGPPYLREQAVHDVFFKIAH